MALQTSSDDVALLIVRRIRMGDLHEAECVKRINDVCAQFYAEGYRHGRRDSNILDQVGEIIERGGRE